MADKFSAETRSKTMSRIKSKWTKAEVKIHNLLKGNRIRHSMHPDLPGNPDVYLKGTNVVIFVDGCFWHNCPEHGHIPDSNVKYWEEKIHKNVKRDKKNTKKLENLGFEVLRIWEHEVMSKEFGLSNIFDKLPDDVY